MIAVWPAIVVVLAVTALLIKGTTESAMVNAALVVVKLVALTAFIIITLPAIKGANFHPRGSEAAAGGGR